MEQNVKNNLSDITYQSELSPAPLLNSSGGLNSPRQLTFTSVSVSCGFIKNAPKD
jgi:hypothetical protein